MKIIRLQLPPEATQMDEFEKVNKFVKVRCGTKSVYVIDGNALEFRRTKNYFAHAFSLSLSLSLSYFRPVSY